MEHAMSEYVCFSVKFLDSRFHGRCDGGEPEWPPSPLRFFQALVAANSDQIGSKEDFMRAMKWLEKQPAPIIIAPRYELGAPYCLSVPNNVMDLVGKAWARGNYFASGDANPATHRTMKNVKPIRMVEGDTIHYLWQLNQTACDSGKIQTLIDAAKRIVALGWGIDLVIVNGRKINSASLNSYPGECWQPYTSNAVRSLRVPISNTFDALLRNYDLFLKRIKGSSFMPVNPLSQFEFVDYARSTDPEKRPFAVFELRHDDGSFCSYPQRKLVHIAGMIRHLAGELMSQSPPPGVDEDWVERYVVGHRKEGDLHHRQFSYLPLPSIGHQHADQLVRRVMISAPAGDDAWLEHLAKRVGGRRLKPEHRDAFGANGPPTLVLIQNDKLVESYTRAASKWASVTPVVLPGHDDRRQGKTRRLIEAALAQSGIEQPCEFEWSPFSLFRKSLSAHKYDKDKQPTGYIRPDHLMTYTAVHVKLRFTSDLNVPGPLSIGAGRHCGLGIFAGLER